MVNYSDEEQFWVYNEIKRETTYKKDRKTGKPVMTGISPKNLEARAIEGRKPHGNDSGIPGRDKVRVIIRDLTNEGRITYIWSGGRKHSTLVALKLDQRMQNDRTLLYATYLRLLSEIKKIRDRATLRSFNERDFFTYVRIKNELSSFPLQVYHSELKASDGVKSALADDLQDNIKKKIPDLKKVEKFQRRRYSNFEKIIHAIEQLSIFQYELYCFLGTDNNEKMRKQAESTIRARRNEIELLIKAGKINRAR